MINLIEHQKSIRPFNETKKPLSDPRFCKAWNMLKFYSPGKFLDVGCADGAFSAPLIKSGWDVWGVDGSKEALLLAETRGLKVKLADISGGLPFPDSFFDFAFAGEIIEHQIDDRYFLSECNRVLVPGGMLILTTPNLVSLQNRILMLLGKVSAPAVDDQHYKVYTLKTLSLKIEQAGFKMCKTRSSHVIISRIRNNILGVAGEFFGNIFPKFGEQLVVLCSKK